MKILYLGAGG